MIEYQQNVWWVWSVVILTPLSARAEALLEYEGGATANVSLTPTLPSYYCRSEAAKAV
jgi:hypothetical protein